MSRGRETLGRPPNVAPGQPAAVDEAELTRTQRAEGFGTNRCRSCGAAILNTRTRNRYVFGGDGRPRRFCSSTCRTREWRKKRAKKASRRA